MKDALLVYEKIINHQLQKAAHDKKKHHENVISESDKKYLFKLFGVIIQNFGTEDLEWFCAAETILNTLFNIKTRNSPEYAKYLIQQLTKKLYNNEKPSDQQMIDDEVVQDDENLSQAMAGLSLRNDITDFHYA